MSGFSGALQLTDLDDFITPSQVKDALSLHSFEIAPRLCSVIVIFPFSGQECIKPVQIESKKSQTGSKIKIQEDGAYYVDSEVSF